MAKSFAFLRVLIEFLVTDVYFARYVLIQAGAEIMEGVLAEVENCVFFTIHIKFREVVRDCFEFIRRVRFKPFEVLRCGGYELIGLLLAHADQRLRFWLITCIGILPVLS